MELIQWLILNLPLIDLDFGPVQFSFRHVLLKKNFFLMFFQNILLWKICC